MLRNDRERGQRGAIAGDDGGDIGGSGRMGCSGCRVIMAGDRRADTPSMENLVGNGVGGAEREKGNPGVKDAG
jgi:hypothetical protein